MTAVETSSKQAPQLKADDAAEKNLRSMDFNKRKDVDETFQSQY